MSLAAGTRLGPYEVSAILGAGGMGEVYQARDTRLHRDVAIKVLPEAFALDADRLARFEREAQVLASLNDPNIAAIYGFEESNGLRALVLELVDGPTLADLLERRAGPSGLAALVGRAALGCVLYEMLTGKRPFEGDDVADTLAYVLSRDPDWSALPPSTPGTIRTLLRGCLERDRRKRIGDVAVALFAIEESSGPASGFATATADRQAGLYVRGDAEHSVVGAGLSRPTWRRAVLYAATLMLGAIVAGAGVWFVTRPAPPRVERFTVAASGMTALAITGTSCDLAITPDGSRIVYLGSGGSQLLVRALDQLDPTSLASGGGLRDPFVSPDGQWVGFFDNTVLKRVAVTGGPAVTVAVTDAASRGATYGPDDTSGHLVYTAGGTLRAVGFDLDRLETRGTSVPVLPRLVTTPNGAGDFALAADGTKPLWARNSKELFYFAPDGALMRVAVEVSGTTWSAGTPTKLLEPRYFTGAGNIGGTSYDISRDGQRFLMIKEADTSQGAVPPQIVVVQNWLEELKRLVPVNQVVVRIVRTVRKEGDMTREQMAVASPRQDRSGMTRDEIVAFFVERRQELWDDFDAAGLAADYADDVVIESPMAGVHTGRAAAEQVLRATFDAFLDLKMKTDTLLIDGDRVAHVVSTEGTHIGEFMGMPPTRKPFHLAVVFIYELRGRKIVRERRIYDFTGLLVQIGMLKAKPA